MPACYSRPLVTTSKFNVKFSEATYGTVTTLAGWMDGTMADVVREAISTFAWLVREYRQGSTLTIQRRDGPPVELALPSLERFRPPPED